MVAGTSLAPESSTDTGRHLDLLEADRLMQLGNIEHKQSRHDEALRCSQGALELFRAHADRNGEGRALGSLGDVYWAQGQHDRAIEHYTQTLDIAREVGSKSNEGKNLGNLGNLGIKRSAIDNIDFRISPTGYCSMYETNDPKGLVLG